MKVTEEDGRKPIQLHLYSCDYNICARYELSQVWLSHEQVTDNGVVCCPLLHDKFILEHGANL